MLTAQEAGFFHESSIDFPHWRWSCTSLFMLAPSHLMCVSTKNTSLHLLITRWSP